MEFWLPYGQTEVPIRVPDDNFYRILEPKKIAKPTPPQTMVNQSLNSPLGGLSPSEFVKPGSSVAILLDPIVPNALRQAALGQLLPQLEKGQVGKVNVLVRKRTSNVEAPQGLLEGSTLLDPASGDFVEAGSTTSGTKLAVNRELLSSDARICITMAGPHFATGFTGGPEVFLPGAASLETIRENRSLLLRGLPSPLDVDVESPVYRDAMDACKIMGAFFSICFVPDGSGGAESVVSGEMETVFHETRRRYLQIHSPSIDRRADIVVVSAASVLGMDLYHAVRVLSNAWHIVKKEGTIILAAECSRGVGDSVFLEYSRKYQEKRELLSALRHRFSLGAHVTLLLQEALEKYRVQLLSVLPDHLVRNWFRLRPSRTASGSIQQAIRAEGKDAKVLIIPRGDLTLPAIRD